MAHAHDENEQRMEAALELIYDMAPHLTDDEVETLVFENAECSTVVDQSELKRRIWQYRIETTAQQIESLYQQFVMLTGNPKGPIQ